MGFNGENGVQEKNTLILPRGEIARFVGVRSEVRVDFFVNIDETRRDIWVYGIFN